MTAKTRRTKGWWQGTLLLAALPWLTPARCLAVATTTVTDRVSRADGTPAQGTVLVSWPSFTAADGTTVAAGTTTVTIQPDGTLTLTLAPNAGADPQGSYYTAVYHLTDGTVQKEYWVVPQAGTATVSQIRAKVVPAAVAQQTVSRQYVDSSISAAQANYLPLKGGALTGALNLAGDPTQALQAATKQYVDANIGIGGGAVTQAAVLGVYHIVTYTPNVVLSTTFNEGAAGATLKGTVPALNTACATPDSWHFGDPATVWNYSSGGAVSAGTTPNPYGGGLYIDVCTANPTIDLSLTNSGDGSLLMLRRSSNGDFVFLDIGGGTVQLINEVGGQQTALTGPETMNLAALHVMLNGQTLTVTDDDPRHHAALVGTLPAGSNATATQIGVTEWAGTGTTIASLTVANGQNTINHPCTGTPQADGTCSPTPANQNIAADNTGHLRTLPEKGTTTDAQGNMTVAWDEDRSSGRYDIRNPAYGDYRTNFTAAFQAVEDQINCDMSPSVDGDTPAKITQGSLTLPPGNFYAGNILLAPGSYLSGMPDGNASKTTLGHNLSTGTMLYMWNNLTTTCADGKQHLNQANHGKIEHLNLHGCGEGGCANVPGDPMDYGGAGGPGDMGLDLETYQGEVEWIAADHFGGTAVRVGGVDSQGHHIYTLLNNEYYLFGREPINGVAYDPSTDGYHGDVELTGVDGQYDWIETYGTLINPGPEYGHIAGIVAAGGDSSFSHLWPQLNEIGILQPYGYGASDRFFDVRVDFSMGEGIVIGDASLLFMGGIVDGSCNGSNVVTILGGACLQLDSRGLGDTFIGMQFAQNPGFGATYQTADIGASYNAKFLATVGTFTKNAAYPYAEQVSWEWNHNPQLVVGPLPDVSVYDSLIPVDTDATTWLGVSNAFPSQDVWIHGGNAMVTLKSTATGGYFDTCSNQDVNLGASRGWLHFKAESAEIAGQPATMGEVCPTPATTANYAVPASANSACPQGVKAFGAAPTGQTGAGWYVCDPDNTWTYYPQTAGTF